MSTYSIGSDSPRWWWPSAAAGVAGAAAIAAILVLPASSSTTSGPTTPDAPPAPVSDPWFSTVDPSVGRQCFALRHAALPCSTDPGAGSAQSPSGGPAPTEPAPAWTPDPEAHVGQRYRLGTGRGMVAGSGLGRRRPPQENRHEDHQVRPRRPRRRSARPRRVLRRRLRPGSRPASPGHRLRAQRRPGDATGHGRAQAPPDSRP